MNQLQVFKNELFKVSAKLENGQPLFDAEQVAKNLGFVSKTTKNGNVYENVRWSRVNSFLPQVAELKSGDFIPESLVYKLAFKASNDIAEKFQDWLAIEVIPSIRKHGAYMTPETIEQALLSPDTIIKLATNLKDEQSKRIKAEQERNEARNQHSLVIAQQKADQPYTTFGKVVSGSEASINVGAFAKLMYDNHGIKLGRNKMFKWLRDNGYLIKSGRERNNPKQQYIEQGLFETTATLVSRSHGDVESLTTLVTGKGQVRIAEHILNQGKQVI